MSTISEIGEFGLIERVKKLLGGSQNKNVLIGIGDDTAAIRIGHNRLLLATCDIQIEGVHFRRDWQSLESIGRRALAVNLSDIAAMGGTPAYAFVSLGLPNNMVVEDYDRLYAGLKSQADDYAVLILGGNISQSTSGLIIDIFLLGEVPEDRLVRRSGACVGDCVFVTGRIGSAAAGLAVLKTYSSKFPTEFNLLVDKFHNPIPRVEMGRSLSETGLITAMLDVSDGLGQDLTHLCASSNVGVEIYDRQIPVPSELTRIENLIDRDIIDFVITGGEDYELLFTAGSDSKDQIIHLSQLYNTPITEIGRIIPATEGNIMVREGGQRVPLPASGWDHLTSVPG